jgi:hypothetical protein
VKIEPPEEYEGFSKGLKRWLAQLSSNLYLNPVTFDYKQVVPGQVQAMM